MQVCVRACAGVVLDGSNLSFTVELTRRRCGFGMLQADISSSISNLRKLIYHSCVCTRVVVRGVMDALSLSVTEN